MVRIRRYFKFTHITRKIVLIILLLLIFDVLAAGLSPLLRERFRFFSGKSEVHILSDLMFLEGAIIFAVGAFAASGSRLLGGSRHHHPYIEEKMASARNVRKPRKKVMGSGILMMIIGASFMATSIAIGVLLV